MNLILKHSISNLLTLIENSIARTACRPNRFFGAGIVAQLPGSVGFKQACDNAVSDFAQKWHILTCALNQ